MVTPSGVFDDREWGFALSPEGACESDFGAEVVADDFKVGSAVRFVFRSGLVGVVDVVESFQVVFEMGGGLDEFGVGIGTFHIGLSGEEEDADGLGCLS